MPSLGVRINCPMCRNRMDYVDNVIDSNADAPRGKGAAAQAWIYRCPVHGTWRVGADGSVLPHSG